MNKKITNKEKNYNLSLFESCMVFRFFKPLGIMASVEKRSIFVPLCQETVQVTAKATKNGCENRDYIFFNVVPRLWHPNLSYDGNVLICELGETPENLLGITWQDVPVSNPANIDATVQLFQGKRKEFNKKKSDLASRVTGETECCICFSECEDNEKTIKCFEFHWVCSACNKHVVACPICRK